MQTFKKEFHEDKSIFCHQYDVQHPNWDLQYKVGYIDLRENRRVVWLPLESVEPNYGDFLQQKAQQHYKDYGEHVVFKQPPTWCIKDETTYGTAPVPATFTKAVTYQNGDKFKLDGYTCVVTDVEKKRNYYIQEINWERVGEHISVSKWVVKVKKVFLGIHGESDETYYINHNEIPKFYDYKTNEDWYDALMEVVNKK